VATALTRPADVVRFLAATLAQCPNLADDAQTAVAGWCSRPVAELRAKLIGETEADPNLFLEELPVDRTCDLIAVTILLVRQQHGGSFPAPAAFRKLRPMFHEARVDPSARLPGQGTGEFHLLRGKEVIALRSQQSLIRTEQLPEERILELARSARE
jgi:hypothetical protein